MATQAPQPLMLRCTACALPRLPMQNAIAAGITVQMWAWIPHIRKSADAVSPICLKTAKHARLRKADQQWHYGRHTFKRIIEWQTENIFPHNPAASVPGWA